MKKTIEITSRNGFRAFSHTEYDNTVRITLEKARADNLYLHYASVTNEQLEGINLGHVNFGGVDFTGSNLADARLDFARLEFMVATGANFRGATATSATLDRAAIKDSNFAHAQLRNINAPNSAFTRCSFFGADLRDANFRDANLAGSDLRKASINGANFQGADLFCVRLTDDIYTTVRRPLFQIGPIGTRDATLNCWVTNVGLVLQTGCFLDTEAVFIEKSASTHRANPVQRNMYHAAINLARIYVHDRMPPVAHTRITDWEDFYLIENGKDTPLLQRAKDIEWVQLKAEQKKEFFGDGSGVTIRDQGGKTVATYGDAGWRTTNV